MREIRDVMCFQPLLNLVSIPSSIGKHKAFIRIPRVPAAKEDDTGKLLLMGHRELRDFCNEVRSKLRIKLFF